MSISFGYKAKGTSGTQVTEQRRRLAEARSYINAIGQGKTQVKTIGSLKVTNISSFKTAINIQSEIAGNDVGTRSSSGYTFPYVSLGPLPDLTYSLNGNTLSVNTTSSYTIDIQAVPSTYISYFYMQYDALHTAFMTDPFYSTIPCVIGTSNGLSSTSNQLEFLKSDTYFLAVDFKNSGTTVAYGLYSPINVSINTINVIGVPLDAGIEYTGCLPAYLPGNNSIVLPADVTLLTVTGLDPTTTLENSLFSAPSANVANPNRGYDSFWFINAPSNVDVIRCLNYAFGSPQLAPSDWVWGSGASSLSPPALYPINVTTLYILIVAAYNDPVGDYTINVV